MSEIDSSAVQSAMQSWWQTGVVGNSGQLNYQKMEGLREEVFRVAEGGEDGARLLSTVLGATSTHSEFD